MGQKDGKYVKTTQPHDLPYKGKVYTFKTCCGSCADQIQSTPENYVVKCDIGICKSGFGLKHRKTNRLVQCLIPKN